MYPGTWAATTPDKPALVMAGSGRTLTYAELDDRSLRLAGTCADAGLAHRRRGRAAQRQHPRGLRGLLGRLRSGLYVTAVNHHLSADEASYIVARLRREGAGRLGARKADLVARAATSTCRTGSPSAAPVAGLRRLRGRAGRRRQRAAAPSSRTATTSSTPRAPPGGPRASRSPLPAIQVDEPGYTYVTIFGGLYGFGQDTVYLSPAPVYHAAPLRFGGVVHALGGTLVMMERFDAEGALRGDPGATGVTHTQMVPTMFVRLLKLPEEVRASYDVSSLRCVVHAAAPCPVEVKRRMIDWLGPDRAGVLRLHRGQRRDMHRPRGLAGAPRLGRHGAARRAAHLRRRRAASCRPGEVGTIYFERDDGAVRLPQRPGEDREPRSTPSTRRGPRWATSATSTRRATSSSPTARRS